MNSVSTSGLAIITNRNSAFFSISKNGALLFTVSPTEITFNVSLNNISVQQLTYLLNITSDVQTQLNNLLNTLNSDVATLKDSITTNVQTLNTTITSKYDALNTAKQDKGNYVAIDANNAITLADNVTFCKVTPT